MTIKSASIWLEVNGLRTHCYRAGEQGPPIILVHGGGMDSARLSWKEVIPLLAVNAKVFAVDLPGYGQTGYREGVTYTNDFYIQFLSAFMDELQLEQAMVMGLSFGGGVVLGFALDYPEKISALCLVGSSGLSNKWNWHFLTYHCYVATPLNRLSYRLMRRKSFILQILRAGLIHKPEHITDALINEIYEEARAPHFGKAFESWQRSEYRGRDGLRSYYGERLSDIQAPTLFVHGAHDRTMPVSVAREAHDRIADAELHVIEEAKHWPQKEYPEAFARIVTAFLEKHFGPTYPSLV